MGTEQLISLILMQIIILPVAYFAWVVLRSTWLALANDRAYARAMRQPSFGPFNWSRYLFMLIWLTLNFVLMAVVGAL